MTRLKKGKFEIFAEKKAIQKIKNPTIKETENFPFVNFGKSTKPIKMKDKIYNNFKLATYFECRNNYWDEHIWIQDHFYDQSKNDGLYKIPY